MKKMADLVIPVFDGEDYGSWKKRVMMYLKLKKCDTVVTRRMSASDKEDEWEEKNLKAINYIYSAISNKQLEFVSEKETAFDIMNKFDELYSKESTALQIVCRNKLDKLRLKDYSDVSKFFTDFEKTVNELKAAGAKITEKEKMNYMLRTLPETYSHIGDLVDVLKEEDQTVEYVMSKIKMMDIKNKDEGEISRSSSSAYASDSNQEPICYSCGKPGHYKRDCRQTGGRKVRNPNGQQHGSNRGNFSHRRGFGNQRFGRGNQRGYRSNRYPRNQGSHQDMSNFHCEIQAMKVDKENEQSGKTTINWLLDSGCTDHVINKDNYFCESIDLKEPINVKIGDGRMLKATKIGTVISNFTVFDKSEKIKMSNVYYVKDMDRNLISYAKITENNNKIVSKGNSSKIYNSNNRLIAIAWKEDKLYKMSSEVDNSPTSVNMSKINNILSNKNEMSLKEKLHRVLGHVNFNYLNNLCKNQMLDGLPEQLDSEYLKCKICIENKMCNLPFNNNRSRAKEILELVHTDLNGPHATTGYRGEKYFLTFIDDYSKLGRVYTIKSKAEVYNCFMQYINEIENLTNKKIKKLRCDNGTEYLNDKIYTLAREKGIVINVCPPYVHELNGTAERYNRSLMDMSRCLFSEAKVNRSFWPEIVCAAAYLKNRTLANTIEKKTPFEIVFNKKPSMKYLKLYGSRVFVRVPEEKRVSKWDRKADLGVLLGYSDVGYRVLVNNRVIVARHVDIIEENMKCIGLDVDDNESVNDENKCMSESQDENVCKVEGDEGLSETKRVRKMPSKYDDYYVYNNSVSVNYCSVDCPESFEEAILSDESSYWAQAMDREIKSLMQNKTWKLVNRPDNKKVLDVKWVYKKKTENNFKARLVVRGFQQKEIIDDIYSPVAKMLTIKILLSYCCQESLIIEQMDVETAFLNGKVLSEIYVKQPRGYEDGSDKVCKLEKALYGLRESPRAWYECFDEFIRGVGFNRSKYDYCLYVMNGNNEKIYLILFVDDILICCRNKQMINNIKGLLSDRFKMKDMGEVKNYLGISIDYNIENNVMKLNQKTYIESLACKYNLENAKLYSTPIEVNLKLEPAEKINVNIKYKNLIGALLYISAGTRPDISYSVNYLSRFQNSFNETHYRYCLRILKYLYFTKDLNLTYCKRENAEILDCFVDADWAGDNLDRKSTSGYVIRMFGNVVCWKSKKQNNVTKSSTFAEYVALSESVSELKLIKDILDFFVKIDRPITVYEDNSGAVAIAKYGNFTKNSKYIEVQYHFVNEHYINGLINIVKIDSDNNLADLFTKSLGRLKFIKFRAMLDLK